MTEIAHDCHVGVQKYVTDGLGLVNSYDTWHGMIIIACTVLVMLFQIFIKCAETENLVKLVGKVAKGTVKEEGKTWFLQLRDKCKKLKYFLLGY